MHLYEISLYIYRFISLQWITIAYNIASLARVLFKKVNNAASNCLILTMESPCNNLYSFSNNLN